MRVITVVTRFPDPTEPFVVDKVVKLAERGIESVVVAANAAPHGDQAFDRGHSRVEVRRRPRLRSRREVARAVMAAAARDRRDTRRAIGAARTARNSGLDGDARGDLVKALPLIDPRADVIHFEDAWTAVDHLRLLPNLRPAKVVTCHGSDVRLASVRSPWYRQALSEVFATVDRIHAVSEELADWCLALGARPEQLHVAPVGTDLRRFPPRAPVSRPQGLALRIVSVGRLHWIKGYEYALEAVRALRDAGHRVTYTVLGADDGGADAVRLAIRDLGLEDVVTLVGHVPPERVRDFLCQSDVFVLSSLSEGSSVATMEAMATGLPVVVTDVGGMAEIVRDGHDGFVVPSRDPAALAAAVTRLLASDVRRDVGKRASVRARSGFDAAAQLDRLVGLYAELVGRPGAAAGPDVDSDMLSVIVVARNAGATIDDQLRALSFQNYEGRWEVVVVDNGSTDDTRERATAWADRLPDLRVVGAFDRRNIAHARNVGVTAAKGARVAMCDADDIVAPGWLAAIADALESHPLVTGALERSALMPAKLRIPGGVDTGPRHAEGFRVRVATGNLGFRREVYDSVGGFDSSLRRGEDLDFGWRAIDSGFEPRFVPGAVVHYRSRSRLPAVARQGFADGRASVDLYARHRGAGMVRPSGRAVAVRYSEAVRGLVSDAWSTERRLRWAYDTAQCLGRLVGSLRSGVLFP